MKFFNNSRVNRCVQHSKQYTRFTIRIVHDIKIVSLKLLLLSCSKSAVQKLWTFNERWLSLFTFETQKIFGQHTSSKKLATFKQITGRKCEWSMQYRKFFEKFKPSHEYLEWP